MANQANDISKALVESEKQLTRGISKEDVEIFDRVLQRMKSNF